MTTQLEFISVPMEIPIAYPTFVVSYGPPGTFNPGTLIAKVGLSNERYRMINARFVLILGIGFGLLACSGTKGGHSKGGLAASRSGSAGDLAGCAGPNPASILGTWTELPSDEEENRSSYKISNNEIVQTYTCKAFDGSELSATATSPISIRGNEITIIKESSGVEERLLKDGSSTCEVTNPAGIERFTFQGKCVVFENGLVLVR